jgi:hypothetical protein
MGTITLSLTSAEQTAFQQLFDLALRNNGMGAFSVVSQFVALMNQAAQQGGAAQAQAQTLTAPATPVAPVAQASHPAAQSLTHPAASQPQPAQHGGLLGTIESALGLGPESGQQHPVSQNAANQHHPAAGSASSSPAAQPATTPAATVTSAPAATPAPVAATATPAAQATGNLQEAAS